MRKLLIIIALTAGVSKAPGELEYIHSAGASYYFSPLNVYPALHYSPRVNFIQMGWRGTMSLDTRLSFGYFAERGTYAEENYFVSFFPVSINWNKGGMSSVRASTQAFTPSA